MSEASPQAVEKLSPAVVATLAMRAAIRAQPTFRPSEKLSHKDARELIEALHVCTWCGSALFFPSVISAEWLHAAIDKAMTIAQKAKGDRPELLAVRLTVAAVSSLPYDHQFYRDSQSGESVISAASKMEPPAFGKAAAEQARVDLQLLDKAGDVNVFRKLPLWERRFTDLDWETTLRDWRNVLHYYDLAVLAKLHSDMLDHVMAGNFDWEIPIGWIKRWAHDESRAPLKEALKRGAAKPTSQQKPTEAIPFDLGRYEFSWGAKKILDDAGSRIARIPNMALSTSAVLMEMAEKGQPHDDPQWSADFLRQALAAYPMKYEEAMSVYRRSRAEGKGGSPPLKRSRGSPSSLMPGLAWSLERAKELAVQTTGAATIGGRHLLAALVVDPPEPYTLGAKRQLEAMGVDVPLFRHRMYEWVRGYGDDDAAWHTALIGTATASRRRPEFDADSTSGPDLLDIQQDVMALATLIAAREASPPLSIGLFGDWGSGKTFFMKQLRHAVAQLSKEARETQVMQRDQPFYKRIVQIEFNAWHYAEGNLWASMVEHILSNLRIVDDQPSTVTETLQQHLIEQLQFTEKALGDAKVKTKEAEKRVTKAEEDVKKAEEKHETKKQALEQLSKKTAARDFRLSGAYDVIAETLKPLGYEPLTNAVADLQSSLSQARNVVERGNAVFTPLLHAADRKNRWRSLLVILLGAPLAALVIGWLLSKLGHERISQISAMATGAAGLLGFGATWLRKQAAWMSQWTEKVEVAQRTYDQALASALADTAAETARTEQELALARQDYTLAQQRAEQARRENDAAQANLAEATTSELLGRFIQDRAASTDYRKHLGVLAIVRQDFQRLSELIEEDNWRLAPDGPNDHRFTGRLKKIASLEDEALDAAKRINRIVLYIDDLDRCPPAKVVDVLQAVHLLLAFPLFVVVVGVDARWISRSLETRYRELLHVDGATSAIDITQMFGVARSEDYLEKIFQIPLWLRSMNATTARRMAQGLLRNSLNAPPVRKSLEGHAATETKASVPSPQRGMVPEQQTSGGGQQAGPPDAHMTREREERHPSPDQSKTTTVSPAKPLSPNLESLQVRDFEVEAIDALSPLLGRSPRALKRFVNLYRLIKAGLTPTEHNAFVRQHEHMLGDYEAVLFLLAVDTGLPRISRAMFDAIHAISRDYGDKHDNTYVDRLVKTLDEDEAASSADWATLKTWVNSQEKIERFNQGIPQLAFWVPRVSRFSFQAAHLELGREAPVRKRENRKAPA